MFVDFSEPDKVVLEQNFKIKLVEYCIPDHLHYGLTSYVFDGVPTGHFLHAVLTDKLYEAVARGDNWSQAALVPLVKFLYNCAPRGCFGDDRKVTAWRDHQGWWGLRTENGRQKITPSH